MTELSQENPDRHQISELENPSAEILKILEEFVINGKYELKADPEKDISRQKKDILWAGDLFVKFSIIYCVIGIIFAALIELMDYFNVNASEILKTSCSIFINFTFLILVLGLILWKFGFDAIKTIQDITENSIHRAAKYEMKSYYEIIDILGNNFKSKYLNKEEIRLKAKVNQEKYGKEFLKKLIPALAFLIVILVIYVIGIPNYERAISSIFNTILNISGLMAILTIVLGIVVEFNSRDLYVYEQCILILQKAQNIAKDLEGNNNTSSINKNVKG